MPTTTTLAQRRDRFRALHREGLFVMPNPMDVGSARLLASMGFPALATTSSGFAATLGRRDYGVRRDELLEHVAALAAAVDVPLNVDSERCFADDPAGVAETVGLLADAGASGCSIEDFDPATGAIDPLEIAVPRVAAAARAARDRGVVLTARAENHLHGIDDLDETIARLQAYRDAGAEVVFAPGVTDPQQIRRLVRGRGGPGQRDRVAERPGGSRAGRAAACAACRPAAASPGPPTARSRRRRPSSGGRGRRPISAA